MYILEVPQALDGRLNSSSTASTIVIPASKKLRQRSSLTLYGKVRLHLSSLSLLCLSLQIRRGTHESWSFQLTLGHVRRQISSWNPGNRENRPNTHSPTPMSIGDGGDFEEECTATCPQQSRLTCKDDELACKKGLAPEGFVDTPIGVPNLLTCRLIDIYGLRSKDDDGDSNMIIHHTYQGEKPAWANCNSSLPWYLWVWIMHLRHEPYTITSVL